MHDAGIYKHKTITELLNSLSKTVMRLQLTNTPGSKAKVRSIIKELEKRHLTVNQVIKFNRLKTRYYWI